MTGRISKAEVKATGTATPRSLADRFADVVNVKDFVGSTDAERVQNFVKYCEDFQVEGEILEEYDLGGTTITITKTVNISCRGAGGLVNGTVEAKGSIGSEVGLTGVVNKGDSVIPVNGTGFVAGDKIFLRSVTNCVSADAGDDRLGGFNTPSFFSEFLTVASASPTQIVTEENIVWEYTNTAGGSSGSRTNSTVQKVNFIDGLKLDLNMTEKTATELAVLNLEYCSNAEVQGDYRIDGQGYLITMFRCLDSVARNVQGHRPAYNIQSSTYNSFLTLGSVSCGVENSTFRGGYQCIDFTFYTQEDLANPSMFCYAKNVKTYNCYDGATSHGGTYSSTIDSVEVHDSFQGIRVRSRFDKVLNCTVDKASGGFGILIAEGYNQGTILSNNTLKNCLYGVHVQLDELYGNSTVPADTVITNTVTVGCATGIEVETRDPTDQLCGLTIDGLVSIGSSSRGVNVGGYCNGVTIKNVTVSNIGVSGRAAVEFFLNVYDLSIDNLTVINCEVPAVRGQSTGSFITDLTTFPDGDSKANLHIGSLYLSRHTGVEYQGIKRDSAIWNNSLNGFNRGYGLGPMTVRQKWSTELGDLINVEDTVGNKVFSATRQGRLNGSKPNSVKVAIAASTDLASLRAALDDLFE